VTFDMVLPSGTSFCDENPACGSTQHLWLMDTTGAALSLGPAYCQTDCSTCQQHACPEYAAILCPAASGVAVTDSTFTWDGSYVENGSCVGASAPSGAAPTPVACVSSTYAVPGSYFARFCATPGTLEPGDGGPAVCTPTGAQQCTQVSFAYPSSGPVVIALPNTEYP
jgi:hypothetical protein